MAYVEPQYNAAQRTSAIRGVWMADQGKDAAPNAGDPYTGTAPEPTAPSEARQSGASRGIATSAGARSDGSGLSDQTRNRIAAQLRAMYDTVALQPVPDRFAELIAMLDGGEREKT